MGNIIKIESREIAKAMEGVTRQYLVGNLKLPQKLQHIKSEELEIGISSYPNYTEEPPHKHSKATEYQYVLSGWTKYVDTENMVEYEFKKGDFYAIETNTSYAQKCKAGTNILFIKVPSINDKEIVDVTEEIQAWYNEGLKTVRKDYSHLPDMPKANSMRTAAAVAIINDGKVLMLKRKDNKKWTLPGGTLELDESLTDCAIREIKEECGLDVNIKDIIGTYTDPNIRIEYSDGEVRREFTIVFYGIVQSDNVIIDDESSEYQWINLNNVKNLPMAESQKKRIADVIEFFHTQKKVFK